MSPVFDRVYTITVRTINRGPRDRHYVVIVFPGTVAKRLAIDNDTYKRLVAAGVPVGKR